MQPIAGSVEEVAPPRDEQVLVEALRRGDESAFLALVDRHHAAMLRVARGYVSSAASAEEVAQEAWLGVVKGIDRFEGRCSVKSWIFRILVNCAKERGVRDARSVPFSALDDPEAPGEPAVEPDRFQPRGAPYAENWAAPPEPWAEDRVLSAETLTFLRRAIDRLPPSQRAVITMRDVEGFEASEACEALGLSEANQRVLLHRARASVRRSLEGYLQDGSEPS